MRSPSLIKVYIYFSVETLNDRLIRLNDKFNSLYGIDYMEARKTLRARLRKKRFKTDGTGLTLAEKILLMRRMKGNFDPDTMDEVRTRSMLG